MTNQNLESTQVGVAGEYFVAAELAIRGFLATITLRNSRGIDIIVSNADASKSASIQVKTSNKKGPKWILNKKSETYHSNNHYYVLVLLNDVGVRPEFYVVPSKVVAEYITINHATWLKGLKADGSPRKDSAIRNFRDSDGEFLEAWDLLSL